MTGVQTCALPILERVIRHEICHLRQFLVGDLKIKENQLFYKGVNQTSIPYLKREFEIEARRSEIEALKNEIEARVAEG